MFAQGDRIYVKFREILTPDGQFLMLAAYGGKTGTVRAVMPDEYNTPDGCLVSIDLDDGLHVILHSDRLQRQEERQWRAAKGYDNTP